MLLSVLKEQDESTMVNQYLGAFSQFLSVDYYIAFLECARQLIKQNKKTGTVQIKFIQKIIQTVDCHVLLLSGRWSQAATKLIELSSIKYDESNPLSEALSLPKKTGLLEFAAYMIILIVMG